MRISLQGSKLLLTDALKEYVTKRLMPLERYLKRFERDGDVLLEVEIARSTSKAGTRRGVNVHDIVS